MNHVLLVAIYALQISSAILAVGLFKKGDQPLNVFLWTTSGQVVLFGLTVWGISVASIVFQYMKSRQTRISAFRVTTAIGVMPIMIAWLTAEVSIRLLSTSSAYGETVLSLHLRPRVWEDQIERSKEILKRLSEGEGYLQHDKGLGWSIRPNHQSADGMYSSSEEGIRSPRPYLSMVTQESGCRIALVGDSFTFGEEVRYEETWAYFLSQYLEGEHQVLNYGVPGYGLDQAYLRYLRDVRPLHADIVVLGVISHDIERTMTVYNFISFPEWGFPFAKPRFTFNTDELVVLNSPVPSPEVIIKSNSIEELPFIAYDRGFNKAEWERTWLDVSYLFRFMTSKFPRWPVRKAEISDDTRLFLNSAIMVKIVNAIKEDGSLPVVVYFPTHGTFLRMSSEKMVNRQELALDVLEQSRVQYTDLTSCVMHVRDSERFVTSTHHYSPQANKRVAKCIAEDIADMGSGSTELRGSSREACFTRSWKG